MDTRHGAIMAEKGHVHHGSRRAVTPLTPLASVEQPGFGEVDLDAQLVFNWDQVFWGATTLLAKLTNAGAYHLLVS